ncbi:DNA alkylation repair protein [Sporolactobacillus terrae]|uniref:DNA alkylation repair protein n=1 Tax=Sporolactobacillus terrae TaxID=269673 RepID=A0A410D6W5_9BACL|nr:DNA alkylation repair protein [Sporolactobacillus terrae]QAA21869.1 DNA alkylation repair protein [Sporolactobacillus terrae]QAA24842.1 DNA alkylation repair protein [Sporolactobacillus terrae]UAK16664.1 DNA alkylation repair protein [Sporolactobacillus terrae]BBN98145.1 hypothetical protein St703_08500 [Sporolactobacillus terrae]
MSYDLQPLLRSFAAKQNQENARAMARYMRDQFPFFGIKTPERRAAVRDFIKQYGLPEANQIEIAVKTLWSHPNRECHYAALDLLVRLKKQLNREHLPLLEWMITSKSWWDTVDCIAPQCCGPLFARDPQLIQRYAEPWIISDHLWLRRAALLFQLKFKAQTDEALLFRYILLNADSDQFFIKKAIGWALREYAKTAPDTVGRFIHEHPLKPLSKREGLKWLNRKSH